MSSSNQAGESSVHVTAMVRSLEPSPMNEDSAAMLVLPCDDCSVPGSHRHRRKLFGVDDFVALF